MAKQWIKQQVRHNEVQDVVDRGVRWALDNRQQAAMGAGSVLIALLLLVGFLYKRKQGQTIAWERLAVAQGYAYAGQIDGSLSQLQQLASDYGGSKAAGYGLLFAGDIMYRKGNYKDAVEYYGKVVDRDNPKNITPIALADSGLAQEAGGQFAQAVMTDQRFLDTYPDHFLAPQVHASLARALMAQGQVDQARAAMQKIALQYPDTPWAAWAQQQFNAKKP